MQTLFCSYCYLLRTNVKKNMKKHSLGVQMLKKGENGGSGYNLSQYLPIPKNPSKIHIYIKYICLNFN